MSGLKNFRKKDTGYAKFAANVKNDEELAWGWHCNVAVAFINEGGTHESANRAAARFMKIAFDVDTSNFKHFKDFEPIWEKQKS